MFVVPLARGRICLGVAPDAHAGAWVVWAAAFGIDVEPLSTWASRKQADGALVRYLAALRKSVRRFLEELERGPSFDGYVRGAGLAPGERYRLQLAVAERIGQ